MTGGEGVQRSEQDGERHREDAETHAEPVGGHQVGEGGGHRVEPPQRSRGRRAGLGPGTGDYAAARYDAHRRLTLVQRGV